MHMGAALYVLARDTWDAPWWVSRQHLMTRLARRGWPVVYGNGPLGTWPEDRVRRVKTAWRGAFDAVPEVGPGVVLVDRPGRWPAAWARSDTLRRVGTLHYAKRLRRAPLQQPVGSRIAFVCHPRCWPIAEQLEPDRVVYYIHDAFIKVPRVAADLPGLSRALAARADLIVAVAANMAVGLDAADVARLHLLPHGVDFQAVAAGADAACPDDLAGIPRPRLGYVGRVNLKTDFEILGAVAERRPDWHWVVVGEVQRATLARNPAQQRRFEALRAHENLHFLGVRHRAQVPAYLAHMDVLTIPYRLDDSGYWSATSPTKLYEYLASGRPVVASALENLLPHRAVVATARTADEWISALQDALANGGAGSADERRALARANTWDDRADLLESWLQELLPLDRGAAARA